MATLAIRVMGGLLVLLGMCLARAEPDSLFEPGVKWDKTEISVCWLAARKAAAKFNPAERLAVQTMIQTEFTLERTGIHFVGFEDCTTPDSSDVVIRTETNYTAGRRLHSHYYEPEVLGQGEIGQNGISVEHPWVMPELKALVPQSSGYIRKGNGPVHLYLYVNRHHSVPGANYLFRLQMHALHEFGHIAGLRHEHILKGSFKDSNCHPWELKRDEDADPSTHKIGDYDPNSIMNYCWEWTFESFGPRIFHIRDLKAFKKYSSGPIMDRSPKFFVRPNLSDPTLYTRTQNYAPGVDLYEIRLGLSAGDVRAIGCMYLTPDAPECQEFLIKKLPVKL